MAFNAQEGALGVARQTLDGTWAAPTDWIKILSGSLGSRADLIVSEPEIGGTRDIHADGVDMGAISYGGSYEFNLRPEALGFFLLSCLGSVASAAFSGAYKHTFTPASALQRLSLFERVGSAYEIFAYTDAVVNKLEFNCSPNEALKGVAEVLAITQNADIADDTESFEDTSRFMFNRVVCKIDGVQYMAKDLSFGFDNQSEDDDFGLGSLFMQDISPGRRQLEVGMTIRPSDSNFYKLANYGDIANSAPDGSIGQVSLNVTASSAGNIPAATVPYSIEIDIPVAKLKPFEPERSGDSRIEQKLMFTPAKDSGDVCTIYVVNGKASYTA